MEERQFRIILTVLALVAVLVVGAQIVWLASEDGSGRVNLAGQLVKLVGLALLPVAAIGLWQWRLWGFWTLGMATAITVLATLPEGLSAAIWLSFLHMTTVLLVVEHYYARKEVAEEHSSDQSL